MFIPVCGSVFQAVKLTELRMKWQQRKENPSMRREDEDPRAARLKEEAARLRKTSLISSIDSKLKAGMELTSEELSYLKANAPALYQEAVEIKQERRAYKQALAACRSKEDVEKLRQQKMSSFLIQARAVSSNPALSKGEKCQQLDKILRRVMGIEAEHRRFTRTQSYRGLPKTEKEARGEEAAPGKEPEKAEKEEEDEGAGKEEGAPQLPKALHEELSALLQQASPPPEKPVARIYAADGTVREILPSPQKPGKGARRPGAR